MFAIAVKTDVLAKATICMRMAMSVLVAKKKQMRTVVLMTAIAGPETD